MFTSGFFVLLTTLYYHMLSIIAIPKLHIFEKKGIIVTLH
ncbi:hypothetical protein CLOSTMETH_00380 [[Clostridium] methylpentosum DSM 5476]|uniref:Uncharacterized protein n=1 Tax=[Clostridium] methylpentosum DSM 5476 TaxID=537013 RepID=C0E982_9FIRM|nr:hypothetical protein CLOSTMETH_00380 [[Clostridium] methylpentosum DSM 5476]